MRSRIGGMKWVILLLSWVFWVVAFGSGAVQAGDGPEKLVIGYQMIPNAEIVAKQLKWQEKALGIPIQWVRYDSGMHVIKAMRAGKVDIGLAGSSPVAAGVCAGVPLEVIWIHDIIGDNEGLVAKIGSGINSVADLKGKRVAAPFGSTTHYHLMVALMLSHIDARQVALVNLEPDAMLNAWKHGVIDAGFVWEPTLSKMVATGGKVILTSRDLVKRGFATADLAIVRKDFGEKYPATVVKYLRTLDRAVKFCRTRPEEAAAAVAKEFGVSKLQAQAQMRGLILLTAQEQDEGKYFGGVYWNFGLYTVLKETADFLKKQGIVETLPARITFMQAVDASYLVKVLEE